MYHWQIDYTFQGKITLCEKSKLLYTSLTSTHAQTGNRCWSTLEHAIIDIEILMHFTIHGMMTLKSKKSFVAPCFCATSTS